MTRFIGTSDHYDRVKKFMQLAGQDTPAKITTPSEEVRRLRAKLILEEALETVGALGFNVTAGNGFLDINRLTLLVHSTGPQLTEIADGFADLSVVTIGGMIAHGIPDVKLLRLVDENNLAKFGPGGHRRADGKWVKPPGHQPPDIAGLLASLQGPSMTEND